MGKSNLYSTTAYDDVFRTLVNDCSSLVIPLINEMFEESYSGEEEIVFTPNEHFLSQQGGSEEKRITDTCFLIIGQETKRYHLECQSNMLDSSILIRVFEYDAQIALDDAKAITKNRITVSFPHTGLLYLRESSDASDRMEVEIITPGGAVFYDVPVLKVESYSIEEIFEKKLLFLIPFYIFTFESSFTKINEDQESLEALRREFQEIALRLENLAVLGVIDDYYKRTIAEMTERVVANLTRKYENIRKGVENIMVGQVLEYEAKTILNQGIAKGRRQGFQQGMQQGVQHGQIMQAVKMYRSIAHYNDQQIISALMKEFSLTEEEAKRYVHSSM